ncbi:MAG: amino acid adenylation domain-containing protein, partial [Oscillospiraceae bacterium]|nr:amino acid adenylation domain-containing protein [Oscillospiraceae bacterium]
ESSLRRLEGITDAVAIVQTSEVGDKVLCAYVQTEEGLDLGGAEIGSIGSTGVDSTDTDDAKLDIAAANGTELDGTESGGVATNVGNLDVEQIKIQLRNHLPDYMVPSHFLRVTEFPVTSSGKLNMRALPEIGITNVREYVAPTTESQEAVVGIFEEMFGLEQVGIKDSFFDLGGNSLKATLLVNQIEQALGVRLGIKDIFQGVTVEGICLALEGLEGSYEPIPQADEKEYYPMSSAQKRLFVLNQIEDTGTAYNMPTALTIKGKLDVDRAEIAFNKLIERHEALRTSFGLMGSEPVQYVHDDLELNVVHKELAEATNIGQAMEAFVRPFDLSKAPLIRAELVTVEEDEHVLLLDMHHIISDGISTEILMSDFLSLYAGEELPKVRVQYKDYTQWMLGRDLNTQKSYWLEQFEDEIPVLELPTDYPRPTLQSFEGAAIIRNLDKSLRDHVLNLAQRTGSTEYMVLLSSFMIVLSKYSNQEDVVVGTPISGRTHRDTENMVGMFVNTLVMRGKPERNKTLAGFIEEIKEFSLQAYENQDYPFEELVEALNLPRDMSRNPLFDVMFTLGENMEQNRTTVNGIQFETFENIDDDPIAKFDLSLLMTESDGGYEVAFEYCTDLFKEETVNLIIDRLAYLLGQLSEKQSSLIGDIELALEDEKSRILKNFNATEMDYPNDKTVIELFEEQAAKAPDKIAMTFEDKHMTYGELNAKSNAIAKTLRDMGVKPGDYVALMTERSMELVIGIYAIIKSGGAYMPVDTECPPERLDYMLKDSQAKAMLTYQVDVDMNLPIIDLADSSVYDGNVENLPIVNTTEDDLCLLYTSGTTGQPKGVMCLHKGTVNLISYLQKYYPMNERVLQKTTYTFDASIVEIFRWSLVGSSGHLLTPGDEKDSVKMCEVIEAHQLTEMQIAPSMLKVFLAQVAMDPLKYGNMLKSLRYVFAGGEAISTNDVNMFYQLVGAYNKDAELVNTYGPTETSVDATHYLLRENERISSIGKPIGNYQAYILNGVALCGIGMVGELCIAGAGVTKGYLNNAELTDEKFIDNPFGTGKLYRTGDATRWLPDGNIEYLGRIDEQVKIRGLRIELGEIASNLRNLPSISDAVVIVQTDDHGEQALCAYVQSENELDVDQIRFELRSNLPDYMIPVHFMRIDHFPVTSNGKLNKRALPKIELTTTKVYVAPITPIEKAVVAVFEEMFKINPIGIKESFFELGGNSLRATLLVNQIEQATGVRLGIKDIFLGVTVEGICLALEDLEGSYEPIPVADVKEYYPISPSQKLYFLTAHLWDYNTIDMTNNTPSALKVRGNFDVEKAEMVFETLLNRHEIFRTSFHLIGNETVAKIHDRVEMDMTYEECYDEEEFDKFARDFVRPFDLEKAPLMRTKVIKTGEENYILFLDSHHIITDGISGELFLSEFVSLYTGGELTPPKLQYKDYSEWTLNRQLDDQKNYWMNHFKNGVPKLKLPEDYPRPEKKKFNGDVVVKKLDKMLSNKVVEIGQKAGLTEFMTWLSVTMILLSNYSDQSVVVGTPISGRTHKDTEEMQGVFINRLLMSGMPEKEKSVSKFLAEVKENCLMAYENQDYPFESLASLYEPQAYQDKSRTPLYDVQYIFYEEDSYMLDEVVIDGLYFQPEEITFTDEEAKFDLVCKIVENGGEHTVTLKFCSDLFKKETIEKMMAEFVKIIDNLCEDQDQTIERLNTNHQ